MTTDGTGDAVKGESSAPEQARAQTTLEEALRERDVLTVKLSEVQKQLDATEYELQLALAEVRPRSVLPSGFASACVSQVAGHARSNAEMNTCKFDVYCIAMRECTFQYVLIIH